MSNSKDKGSDKRRRSSISRGRRSLASNAVEDDDNATKLKQITGYEKYRENLYQESGKWTDLLQNREARVRTAEQDLQKPLRQKDCRLGLAVQNFIEGRLDYGKIYSHAAKFDSSAAAVMAHLKEADQILTETVRLCKTVSSSEKQKAATEMLSKQRPVREILADLAKLQTA